MADLYYYETGYIDDKYHVYVANADSVVGPFIVEGYIEAGFFVDDSIQGSLSCIAGKLKESSSEISAAFTQSATISHIHGADLVAFSEAAIAVAIEVTRQGNVELSTLFDIATDYIRRRRSSSDISSLFTQSSINERGRGFDSSMSAAFSFVGDGDIIGESKDFAADITATASVSAIIGAIYAGIEARPTTAFTLVATISHIEGVDITAENFARLDAVVGVIKPYTADISAEVSQSTAVNVVTENETTITATASQTADNDRLRDNDLSSSITADLFAVISHIEGADIVVNGFADLTASGVSTKDINSSLSSQSSIAAIIGTQEFGQGQLQSTASVYTSRYFGSGRPRNITGGTYNASIKKFGTHSLSNSVSTGSYANTTPGLSDDWVAEGWFYSITSGQSAGITILTTEWLQITISNTAVSTTKNFYVQTVDSSNNGNVIINQNRASVSLNTWHHVAVVKTGSTVSVYFNGTRIATASQPTSYRNDGSRFINIGPFSSAGYVDEVSLRIGNTYGYSAGSTTISVPTEARTNDPDTTQFLYHFDGNGNDDMSGATQTASASITSTATFTATLSGPQRGAASVIATASIITIGSVDRGADITVDNFASLTADVTNIKQLDSAMMAEGNLTANINVVADFAAILETSTESSLIPSRLRSVDISTEAVGVILAVVVRTGDFVADLNSQVVFAVDANKITDILATLTADSNTNAIGEKYGSLEAYIDSNSSLESTISITRDGASVAFIEFAESADVNAVFDTSADLESVFTVMADAKGGTIRITLLVESFADLSATGNLSLEGQATLSADTALSAETGDSLTVRIVSDMFSDGSVDTVFDRIRDNDSAIDAFASELVVIDKTAGIGANLNSTASISTDISKFVGYDASISTLSALSADVERIQQGLSTLSSEYTVYANGRTNAEAAADVSIEATLTAVGVKGTDIPVSLFDACDLTITATIIRDFVNNSNADTSLIADVSRTRDINADLPAVSTELVVVTVLKDGISIQAGTFTVVAQAGVLHLQEYVWKIAGESRYYKVNGESRYRAIAGESRVYTIRR